MTDRPHLDAALDAHQALTTALEDYVQAPTQETRRAGVCAALLVAEKLMADGRQLRQESMRAPTWTDNQQTNEVGL
jgi:hypothetical protein